LISAVYVRSARLPEAAPHSPNARRKPECRNVIRGLSNTASEFEGLCVSHNKSEAGEALIVQERRMPVNICEPCHVFTAIAVPNSEHVRSWGSTPKYLASV
jgi:hypothetical protein